MSGHVFVSYSRSDTAYVLELVEHLRSGGLRVWVDSEIDYGDQWETVIRTMIDTCAVFVPVMSPASEESSWVAREVHRAEELGKPVLPLLLAGKPFFRLGTVHYEDVRGGAMPAPRFTRTLRHLVGTPSEPPLPESHRTEPHQAEPHRTEPHQAVPRDDVNPKRTAVARGVEAVARAVRTTIGPRGRACTIRCGDGVYRDLGTAREIVENYVPDLPVHEPGVHFVRDLVREVLAEAGDGVATAVVLADALLRRLVRELDRGASPELLERGVEAAARYAVGEITGIAREVETKEQVTAVVTAAVGDRAIGEILAEAMDRVGKEGVITVEENVTLGLELELVEGMRFDRGFLSTRFVTDEARQEAVLDEPHVLLHRGALSSAADVVPLLEKVASTGRPLLVVADDVAGGALTAMIAACGRGAPRSVAVKAPAFGARRAEVLEDLAALTGGFVADGSVAPADLDVSWLGGARRVVVTAAETTVVEAFGEWERITERVDRIRAEIERCDSDCDREKLQERLAKLAGGVAVVKYGGLTPARTAEHLRRCELGRRLAAAAVAHGILPGGGAALVTVGNRLAALDFAVDDQRYGARALLDALAEPMAQIVRNAGADLTSLVPGTTTLRPGFGVDVTDLEVKDMIAAEVIDVAGTTRAAVVAAARLASRVLRIS